MDEAKWTERNHIFVEIRSFGDRSLFLLRNLFYFRIPVEGLILLPQQKTKKNKPTKTFLLLIFSSVRTCPKAYEPSMIETGDFFLLLQKLCSQIIEMIFHLFVRWPAVRSLGYWVAYNFENKQVGLCGTWREGRFYIDLSLY